MLSLAHPGKAFRKIDSGELNHRNDAVGRGRRSNRLFHFTADEREFYETLLRSFRPGEFLKIIPILRAQTVICYDPVKTISSNPLRNTRCLEPVATQ